MVILILFSFLSGFVTVLSPCILPVLPIVLSSSAARGKRRPLGVILGLIISFSIFTLLITQIVRLLGLSANTLRIIAVVIIGFLGLSMIIPKLNEWVERAFTFLPRLAGNNQQQGNGFFPGFITGLSLGLVWAPCAGPILASVTTLAATQSVNFGAAVVVVSYAIGAGIPLLGIAYGGRSLINRVPFLSKNLGKVQKVFGVVMILTAVAIALNFDVLVTSWLTQNLPNTISSIMSRFESSSTVQNQLSQIEGSNLQSNYFASPTITVQELQMGKKLPDLGPAPDFTDITNWINSPPLTTSELRGKVVVIDFWTYSCINCVRTIPYLNDWYAKYKDKGLVIVGVHTPEFEFEKDTKNVEAAVKRYGIMYPVAQDNNYGTWSAYNNRYWPAEYFIDANGNVRYTHFGEGKYDESELVIQQLLEENGAKITAKLVPEKAVPITGQQTPETYIGYSRLQSFASPEPLQKDQAATYSIPTSIPLNEFAVSGSWNFGSQAATALQAGDKMTLHFTAKDVYLVMSSQNSGKVKITIDSPQVKNQSDAIDQNGEITINEATLYHIVSLSQAMEAVVTIEFLNPNIEAYDFTFGS